MSDAWVLLCSQVATGVAPGEAVVAATAAEDLADGFNVDEVRTFARPSKIDSSNKVDVNISGDLCSIKHLISSTNLWMSGGWK